MTKDEALSALARIEKLIGHFGGPNTQDHREYNSLIFSLHTGPFQFHYFREKLSELEQSGNDGFSVRKFANRAGGLQQVKVWALGSLATARSLVEQHWPQESVAGSHSKGSIKP